jgi:hypothetical protein
MNIPRENQQSRGASFSSHTSSVRGAQPHERAATEAEPDKGLQELFSSYKVTALQDVTIRACVSEKPEWVNLQAGEVRHGLKTILGVHPNDAPNTARFTRLGLLSWSPIPAVCLRQRSSTVFFEWSRKTARRHRGFPRFCGL